jgi:hypothetical protein
MMTNYELTTKRKNMLGRVDRNTLKFHWAALSLGWLFDPILAHSMSLGRPHGVIAGVLSQIFAELRPGI